MLYKGLIRANKRTIVAEMDIPIKRAIDFLKATPSSIIQDESGKEYTLEELIRERDNVKSVRPTVGIKRNSEVTGVGSFFEDTDRELPRPTWDRTESRTKRDN